VAFFFAVFFLAAFFFAISISSVKGADPNFSATHSDVTSIGLQIKRRIHFFEIFFRAPHIAFDDRAPEIFRARAHEEFEDEFENEISENFLHCRKRCRSHFHGKILAKASSRVSRVMSGGDARARRDEERREEDG
jgi:hypothetical protein